MYHKDIGSCEMYRHKTNARVQIPEGEKFMNERNVRPFSKRDEIGYVFGDMAGSFVNLFVIIAIFLLILTIYPNIYLSNLKFHYLLRKYSLKKLRHACIISKQVIKKIKLNNTLRRNFICLF